MNEDNRVWVVILDPLENVGLFDPSGVSVWSSRAAAEWFVIATANDHAEMEVADDGDEDTGLRLFSDLDRAVRYLADHQDTVVTVAERTIG